MTTAEILPTNPLTTIASLPEAPKTVKPRLIGEYLVTTKLVGQSAVDAALREQSVTSEHVGTILVRNGFLSHKDLVHTILALDKSRIAHERVNKSRVPAMMLDRLSILMTAETDRVLYVSTMDSEEYVLPFLKEYYPDKDINFTAFMPDNIADFIDRMERVSDEINQKDGSTGELLEKLIYSALAKHASDIHIEPRLKSYTVFYRILGVRRIVYEGSLEEYTTLISRIKDMSRMDVAERRIPQDGGMQIEHGGKLIDIRVATSINVHGEKAVLRLLDPDRVQPHIARLGITRLKHWNDGCSSRNGLLFICGGTGSGKTTTLNATIRGMDRFENSINTVEDPVEYQLAYVNQVSINMAVGLDYSKVTRNFMRCDPDVIVLGEVRDKETAREVLRAAATGHLVLATLHTGTIQEALDRMRDLDVPPQQLRSFLRGILVQTLLRTKCDSCGGEGCVVCGGSGFGGQTIVSECQSFIDPVDIDRAIGGEVFWPTILDDAMGKVDAGITTEEEVIRIFGAATEVWKRKKGLIH